MSSRCAVSLLVPVLLCTLFLPAPATAQPAATPQAPAQTPAPTPAPARGPERVAIIDMQGAIAGCNEGLRDFGALDKTFQPRRAELARLGTELQGLQKQFNSQGPTMTPAARDAMARSIDTKTKTLQRMAEDTEKDQGQQVGQITDRILQKLAPILRKYADDHGFGLVLDASQPWPQGVVVLVSSALDITKPVVEAYNAQSGVPAPSKNPE